MFRKLFTLLIMTILLLQSVIGLLLWTNFQSNRDDIAKTQCENRFNALASKCHGQCVLMKKMKKIRDAESKSAHAPTYDYASIAYLPSFFHLHFTAPAFDGLAMMFPNEKQDAMGNFSGKLFRPPHS